MTIRNFLIQFIDNGNEFDYLTVYSYQTKKPLNTDNWELDNIIQIMEFDNNNKIFKFYV